MAITDRYVDTANCKFVVGGAPQLATEIQALITAARTIVQVVKLRETGVYLIIHTV
jgi:hypothetical protein